MRKSEKALNTDFSSELRIAENLIRAFYEAQGSLLENVRSDRDRNTRARHKKSMIKFQELQIWAMNLHERQSEMGVSCSEVLGDPDLGSAHKQGLLKDWHASNQRITEAYATISSIDVTLRNVCLTADSLKGTLKKREKILDLVKATL